jgi:hypothetical protein
MSENNTKLEFFGLLAADPKLKIEDYISKLKTPIARLRRWEKEFKKIKDADDMEKVIHADELIVEGIVNSVSDRVFDASEPPALAIDPETDEILEAKILEDRIETRELKKKLYKEKKLAQIKTGITILQALEENTQKTASTILDLVQKRVEILDNAIESGIQTKELTDLAKIVVDLQTAYFKQGAKIQINQMSGSLSSFRERLGN